MAALSRQIRNIITMLVDVEPRAGNGETQDLHRVATNVKIHFCDPPQPLAARTNENSNRLLRQYLPKKTDLSGYAQSELDKIALRRNQRPRNTLELLAI